MAPEPGGREGRTQQYQQAQRSKDRRRKYQRVRIPEDYMTGISLALFDPQRTTPKGTSPPPDLCRLRVPHRSIVFASASQHP
jgi:hypothetical protein